MSSKGFPADADDARRVVRWGSRVGVGGCQVEALVLRLEGVRRDYGVSSLFTVEGGR